VEEVLKGGQYTNVPQVAAVFMTISSALLTSLIRRLIYNEAGEWSQYLEALTWTAVGWMYLASLWKLTDVVVQKEKRRRLLTTGQI
jgi:hypothetical protein